MVSWSEFAGNAYTGQVGEGDSHLLTQGQGLLDTGQVGDGGDSHELRLGQGMLGLAETFTHKKHFYIFFTRSFVQYRTISSD